MRTSISVPTQLRSVATALAASLPDFYSVSEPEDAAGLVVLDGSGNWVAAAAEKLSAGRHNLLVHAPGPVDPGEVDTLAARTSTIVLSEPFAGNPVLKNLPQDIPFGAVSSTALAAPETPVERALLEQIRSLRAAGFTDLAVENAQITATGALLTGEARHEQRLVRVRALVTRTSAVTPHHVLRAYSPEHVLTVTLPDPATAAPGTATLVGPDGERILPTDYESAHRRTWRLAHESPREAASLRDFADDLRVLGSIS
ncbi:hypothetical protein [Kineosporia babensis]|uniref:Uncharacterized protein n=1 Tax=Kineosporia babensis TaxID=499548 RepID=A0A9X1SUU8_9ACTN|nr:hypothetical protein [Kineosporia babensis]MCD5312115.1 hypothetical protein [Kineosporia babensis]